MNADHIAGDGVVARHVCKPAWKASCRSAADAPYGLVREKHQDEVSSWHEANKAVREDGATEPTECR